MKKRWIVMASILVSIGIAIALVVFLKPRSDVTDASFDRIEIGMTLESVEAIFGCQPSGQQGTLCVWAGDEKSEGILMVLIELDEQGRVASKEKGRTRFSLINKLLLRWMPSEIL